MIEWKPEIRQRLAGLKLAPTREAAIVEELAQHLDDCYEELLAGGATEDEAYRATLAELSESEILARELRRVERQVAPEPIVLGTNRRTNMIADLWQDLRYGARMLSKKPGFTALAVIALALGIGASTAIFSVINAVLLQPLPFHDPDRLVRVWRASAEEERSQISFPDFADLRAQQSVFERMAAWRISDYTLTGKGDPVNLRGVVVTADLFPLLGAALQLGRSFTPEEDQAGNRAVILSHSLWQQRFNADPDVVGKTVTINSRSYLNSFLRLQHVNPGFDSHNVLTFRIGLPANRYSQQTQVAPFYQQLISRLEAAPGVKSVSAISHLPLSPQRGTTGFSIEGIATAPDNPAPYITDFRSVTPGYFKTMGMQLVKGRDFTARDELRSTSKRSISIWPLRSPNRNSTHCCLASSLAWRCC